MCQKSKQIYCVFDHYYTTIYFTTRYLPPPPFSPDTALFAFIYPLYLLYRWHEVFSINWGSKYIFYLSLIRNRWRGDLSSIDCSRTCSNNKIRHTLISGNFVSKLGVTSWICWAKDLKASASPGKTKPGEGGFSSRGMWQYIRILKRHKYVPRAKGRSLKFEIALTVLNSSINAQLKVKLKIKLFTPFLQDLL